MKLHRLSILALTFMLLTICCAQQESQNSYSGEYLGQEKPGFIGEIFGPGHISTDSLNERDITFTPNLNELYFTRGSDIMGTKTDGDKWSEPIPTSFTYNDDAEPFITADGKKLYFVSQRPTPEDSLSDKYRIWFVEKNETGWSEPRCFNDETLYYPTITNEGVMYVTDNSNKIFRSKIVDDQLSELEKLDDSVNTPGAEYNSFIAPDESYLIFTSFGWTKGYGSGDLYICFRKEDGSWTTQKNMGGGINSASHEYCPSVSPDGKYLFFVSNKGGTEDLYWVDAGIIEHLRTNDLNVADRLYDTIKANGIKTLSDKFHELKKEYSDYCIFDKDLLSNVADKFLMEDNIKIMIEIMKVNCGLFPQSQTLLQRYKLAVAENDKANINKLAAEIKQIIPSTDVNTERKFNLLGYMFLLTGKIDEGVEILKINSELFPESFNTFDSYAEALLINGDTTLSIDNYKKSLELNPENSNAEDVLKQLGAI